MVRELLLPSSKRAILAVSTALLEHGAIDGDHLRRIASEAEALGKASADGSDQGPRGLVASRFASQPAGLEDGA